MQIRLTISGVDALDRALAGMSAEIERAIADAAREAAPIVAASIARETPVRTGFLRSSETATARPSEVMFEAAAEYASFVAYGTTRQAANPFVERGVTAAEDQTLDVFESAIGDVTQGVGGGE